MVSRSQHHQESTMLHSSGASNSSGSTTAVAVAPEPPTNGGSGGDSSKTPLQLLRRSRKSVASKMKLSNLFRSSHKHSHHTAGINHHHNDPVTTTATTNATNDWNGNDNATISSVIVTMDTTMEEKHREMANTTVWMESLYQSEIPMLPPDEDGSERSATISDHVRSTQPNDTNVDGTRLYTEDPSNNEILLPEQQQLPSSSLPPVTSGPLFCNAPMGVPFFDRMCHIGRTGSEDSETILSDNRIKHNFHNTLPDDPSIQESFECFFMAQQESMFKEQERSAQKHQKPPDSPKQPEVGTLHNVANTQQLVSERSGFENDDQYDHTNHIQTPPSMIHQSLLKNRSISRLPLQFQRDVIARSPRSSLQQQQRESETASATNMFQQRIPPPDIDNNNNNTNNSRNSVTTRLPVKDKIQMPTTEDQGTTEPIASKPMPKSSCICCQRPLPLLEPKHWPQRPLLLRPTPNSGTRIRGIRFVSSSNDYLWRADQNDSDTLTWPQALRKHWEKDTDASKLPPPTPTSPNSQRNATMCSQCLIIPINNGKELPGESLVSDFESELFIGTILVRLKDCHGTTIPNQVREQTNGGYFHNLHRRYQVVIRGQFKQSLPWTECIAGFQYVPIYTELWRILLYNANSFSFVSILFLFVLHQSNP